MSKPQRGERPFGPGQTVLASSFGDDAPAGVPGPPPATVRDPSAAFAPAYAPQHPAPFDDVRPVGIPPPPPGRGRGRGRGRSRGPSLLAIGVASFFVIGGLVTTLAVLKSDDDDDRPAPTVNVPAPTSVPPDPGALPADPGATPRPAATARRTVGPRTTPTQRPPARITPSRPGNQQPPRYPPGGQPRRPPPPTR